MCLSVCSENCKRREKNVNRLRHRQFICPSRRRRRKITRISVKLNMKKEKVYSTFWMVDRQTWVNDVYIICIEKKKKKKKKTMDFVIFVHIDWILSNQCKIYMKRERGGKKPNPINVCMYKWNKSWFL